MLRGGIQNEAPDWKKAELARKKNIAKASDNARRCWRVDMAREMINLKEESRK